jgi:hypothetical protein
MATDVSMIWLYPEEQNILDETILLSKRNMILRNRAGRKMFVIKPTHREPSHEEIKKQNEDYWANQWKLINEFKRVKKPKTTFAYTMNDIISVNNSPKLEKLIPELVVHDFSFNWRK